MVESVTSRRIVDCSLFIITTDSKLAFVWRERQRPNLFGVLKLAALVARRGVVPTYAEIKFSRRLRDESSRRLHRRDVFSWIRLTG